MPEPLRARGLVSGYGDLPSLPQRVLPQMNFAMVNGQPVPLDDDTPDTPTPIDTPATAPLASSRDDIDPAQVGALIAQLMHAAPARKGGLTPPTLSPGAATLAAQPIEPPLAVSHAQVPVSHIGAPQVGERYVPPTFGQIMTSRNPAQGLAENFLGAARPAAVARADPYGIEAWMKGAGPPPGFIMGSTEEVAGPARGLYSRVEDVANALPERGVHPSKVASLLKSGASQEEVAYRKVPEFLASRGQQPVTRAELQAHLSANPAPFPETTVLGPPQPGPGRYSVFHEGTDGLGRALRVEIRNPDGSVRWSNEGTPVSPDNLADLITTWHNHPVGPPSLNRTKYSSHTLPEGENYREHLLQLPKAPDPALQALTDRREAIRDSIAAIDVPLHTLELPTDPQEARAWVAEQAAHRRTLMDEHMALNEQIAERQQRVPARSDYQEGHYGGEYPNVLAHVRTKERTLPATGRSLDDISALVTGVRRDPTIPLEQRVGSGAWSIARDRGLITPDEAAVYAQAQGYSGVQPPGSRGRFIEEIQSDWHQTGKRVGYQGVTTPETQARLKQLAEDIETTGARTAELNRQHIAVRNTYLDQLQQATRTYLPPEFADLTSFSQAMHRGEAATSAWRAAREKAYGQGLELTSYKLAEEQLERDVSHASGVHQALQAEQRQLLTPSGVPDAPFKEAWPDLALKQQLLDVAKDPNAHWLGFTGGETQADRYDLSKQVSKLTFEPHDAGDYSLGTLVAHDLHGDEVMRKRDLEPKDLDAHIGKEPADLLRQKFVEHERMRAYERDQWSIEPHETGSGFVVHDPNGEILHRWDGKEDWFPTKEAAQEHIDGALDAEHLSEENLPHLSGLDLKVGGKGMRHFYDNLLPARLRKILKPFGGTVEPFDLPTGQGYQILNQEGESIARYDTLANAEADLPRLQGMLQHRQLRISGSDARSWITHLSPEMKREILRKGFPLLTLPLAAGAASLASRPGANVGTPPPVEPPMAVSHEQRR